MSHILTSHVTHVTQCCILLKATAGFYVSFVPEGQCGSKLIFVLSRAKILLAAAEKANHPIIIVITTGSLSVTLKSPSVKTTRTLHS